MPAPRRLFRDLQDLQHLDVQHSRPCEGGCGATVTREQVHVAQGERRWCLPCVRQGELTAAAVTVQHNTIATAA